MKAPSPDPLSDDDEDTTKKTSGDFSRMVGFLKYNANELTQKDHDQRHNSQRALEAWTNKQKDLIPTNFV